MEINVNLCLKFDETIEFDPIAIVNRLASQISESSYLVLDEMPLAQELHVECGDATAVVYGDSMKEVEYAKLCMDDEEDDRELNFVAFNRRSCLWWTGECSRWYYEYIKGMGDNWCIYQIRRDRSVDDIRESLLRVVEKRYGWDTDFATQMEWG